MRVCIIGGGKVGYYLAKTLLEHQHTPVVIEPDYIASEKLANALDIPVIHGSGTNIASLREARCEECRAMACVSGKDEVNLVSAQLGKAVFHVAKTIVRVNNPQNTTIVKSLGVDIAVSSTYTIAQLIETEVETSAVRYILGLANGDASLIEIVLPKDFRYSGQTLLQLTIPKDVVVMSITRGNEFIIPRGDTVVLSEDRIIIIATDSSLHAFIKEWHLDLS